MALTAFLGALGLFPLGRIIYVLRTQMEHKPERVIRNLGLAFMAAFVAESLGTLFWAMNHKLVLLQQGYRYDVPEHTRSLLDNISWGLTGPWIVLLTVAWFMKRSRLRRADLAYLLTKSAITAEYGPVESRKIDQRTGLTKQWLRGLRDDL